MDRSRRLLKIITTFLGLILVLLLVWIGVQFIGEQRMGGYEAVVELESKEDTVKPSEEEKLVILPREEEASQGDKDGKEDLKGAESKITIAFAGDVLLSDHVISAYDKAGSVDGILGKSLQEQIAKADIFMVNEEFPFSSRGSAAADKQYTFRLPPDRVHIMNELGVSLVTLANNHALDFGTDALLDTLTTLDGAGIPSVGAGENLERAKRLETMEINGRTIGFLGASRVIPVGSWNAGADAPGMLTTYDPAILAEEIKKAREVCDFVVVYVHWGIERSEKPEGYQRTLGETYIDMGADLVVGSHPHVLQGIEYYKGKPIVYSLGNFVFGSSIPRTALLLAQIEEDELKLQLIPCTSSAGLTNEITDESKKAEFYRYMESISFAVTFDEEGTVSSTAGSQN